MNNAIDPLVNYLKIFKKIQNEIKLDPDEWFMSQYAALVQDLDASNNKEENERKENEVEVILMYDLQQIKAHINNQIERESELRQFIPDKIQVGIFDISFDKIKNKSIQKHK